MEQPQETIDPPTENHPVQQLPIERGEIERVVQDLIDKTVIQIAAKSGKSYPPGTVLIVRCVPDGIVLPNEWEDAVRRMKDAGLEFKFREVFLTDNFGKLSATLYSA